VQCAVDCVHCEWRQRAEYGMIESSELSTDELKDSWVLVMGGRGVLKVERSGGYKEMSSILADQ